MERLAAPHAHHGSAVHTCPGARCAPCAPRGRHPHCRRALGCQITPNHGAKITHPNFCLNWKRGQSLGHSLARAGHRMGCGHWVQFAYKPFDLITLGPKMRSSAWVVQARTRAQVPLPWAAGGCGDPQQTQTATGPLEMRVEGQDRARGSGWRGLGRAAGCGAGKALGTDAGFSAFGEAPMPVAPATLTGRAPRVACCSRSRPQQPKQTQTNHHSTDADPEPEMHQKEAGEGQPPLPRATTATHPLSPLRLMPLGPSPNGICNRP